MCFVGARLTRYGMRNWAEVGMSKNKAAPVELFDLNQFYERLEVPKEEQQAVSVCFEGGLDRYRRQLYGPHAPDPQLESQVEARLDEPYIFGFGAVEAVRRESLSLDTRLKIVRYAVETTDVTAEFGISHGLPVMVAFLAQVGKLEPAVFRSMMITADLGERMFDDWRLDEVRQVCDWLTGEADLPELERTWWLWLLCVKCEDKAMTKLLVEGLLAHPSLTKEHKRTLCDAWLTDVPAGEPPAQWKALQALLRGDVDTFAARAAEAGLPLVEADLPSREEIESDYDADLDILIDQVDEGGASTTSLHVLRKTLVGPSGVVMFTPVGLKRTALHALLALGEDVLSVCQRYLGRERGPAADTVNQSVAELIRLNAAELPKAEVRALIERGLKSGGLATRKTFYQLGADLLGPAYWQQAGRDPARSIREWAAKKSDSAPTPTRPRKAAKKKS